MLVSSNEREMPTIAKLLRHWEDGHMVPQAELAEFIRAQLLAAKCRFRGIYSAAFGRRSRGFARKCRSGFCAADGCWRSALGPI